MNKETYYTISKVFAAVKKAQQEGKKSFRLPIGGRSRSMNINMSIKTFMRSLKCAGCGLEGKYFRYERKQGLRLAGVVSGNHERLFSSDHIVPKSKGGSGRLSNRQTMCDTCNRCKADQTDGYYYEKATYCLLDFRRVLGNHKKHPNYEEAATDWESIRDALERQGGKGDQYLSFFQAVSLVSYFQFTWNVPIHLEDLDKYPANLQEKKPVSEKVKTPWYEPGAIKDANYWFEFKRHYRF